MASIRSLLQRSTYAWRRRFARDYAWGVRWCEQGFRLDQTGQQSAQLNRLAQLIDGFRQRGLCEEAAWDAYRARNGFAAMQRLPVLTRQGLRGLWPRLSNAHVSRPDIYSNSTGGSTGEPVTYLRSKLQDRLAGGASYAMHRILGWLPGMQRLCLWGSERDIGQVEQGIRGLRGWLQDTSVMGGYAADEAGYQRFVSAVRAHPGCAVYGFTSLLAECSRLMLEHHWVLPGGAVAAAWVGAEALTDTEREVFRRAFGVPLRDHYGSRECSSIAVECAEGRRHVNPRYIVEAVEHDSRRLLSADETGTLLVTDLFNDVTPLIRYEIGDLGAVRWEDCACGRRGPCLSRLAGRLAATIELPSGKQVSSLFFNHLLKEFPAVREFQVQRHGPAEFALYYCGSPLDDEALARLTDVAGRMLEGACVTIEWVEQLARGASGKLAQYRDMSGAAD